MGDAVGDVGGEWDSCPVAQLHGIGWLVEIYARHKMEVLPLAATFEDPTLFIVDAMTEFRAAENAIERAEIEAEDRKRKLRGATGAS